MIQSVQVIVMAKYPAAGQVKTRLQPDISADQAAAVVREMLLHLVSRLAALQPAELVICYDPPHRGHEMQDLLRDLPTRFLPQSPGDLGSRLAAAHAAAQNPVPTLFLGVDSPDLPPDHLRHAARLCRQADVVLGPTRDGGYWCLGLGPSVDVQRLLTGIDWSSGREAAQTVAAAHRLGVSVALADTWDDVDHVDDLHRLMARLKQSDERRDIELRRRLMEICEVNDNG